MARIPDRITVRVIEEGMNILETNQALIERVKQLESALDKLARSHDDLIDVATWYTSFYHDVQNTTPEYFELCADLNAVMYLHNEAQAIQERARALLASEQARRAA